MSLANQKLIDYFNLYFRTLPAYGKKGKGDFTIASWVKFYPHPGFYDYDASWELSN